MYNFLFEIYFCFLGVGGGKKVTRVQVTLDGGETWKICNLEYHEKPNKYGKYWCWIFWSVDVEILDLFGSKQIAVRAWDETTNTQPENLNWNLMVIINNYVSISTLKIYYS